MASGSFLLLKEVFQLVDWERVYAVQQMLDGFCKTNMGRVLANEVWNTTVPGVITKPPQLDQPGIQPDGLKHLKGPGQLKNVDNPRKGIR